MRIAVIGSGIAGLASAWLLSRRHQVTLFEANRYFGGHTHTHEVAQAGRSYRIDSGFIVHNPLHYPLFTGLLGQLGVASQPTQMSFSVHSEASGLEYNTASLGSLFCQPRNLFAPRFLGMVRDLVRFYREAPQLLTRPEERVSLGDYLEQNGYGTTFRDQHLIPMASALWSSPATQILQFPARYLVQFMANHQMMQLSGRPQWRVVQGGSSTYVAALRAQWSVRERLGCPVRSLRRFGHGVEVDSMAGSETFDQVVLAVHSDQALDLLADANDREQEILGAIGYQDNHVVLHTDASVLPRQRKAWAAWNAWIPRENEAPCSVSYWMNLLQGIESPEPFVVSLNRGNAINPDKVLAHLRYQHPVYSHAAVQAQARKAEIQGQQRTWFAGAYWGWGFHEDGMQSAVEVAAALGVRWSPDPSTTRHADLPASVVAS